MSLEVTKSEKGLIPLFINIGFGNHVSVDSIRLILDYSQRKTSGLVRRVKNGQETGFRVISLYEANKKIRSVLLLEDNSLVLSPLSTDDLLKKLNYEDYIKDKSAEFSSLNYQ